MMEILKKFDEKFEGNKIYVKTKPNCYECKYRKKIPGSAHSECKNGKATVKGDEYGIRMGWFNPPFNFDPAWLEECDGFEIK